MKTYFHNGEYWYVNNDSLLKRICTWFVWNGSISWRCRYPISLFGHRITFFGWGWQMRTRHGYVTFVGKREGIEDRRQLYRSPDGTPSRATAWYIGAPYAVVKAAEEKRGAAGDGYL